MADIKVLKVTADALYQEHSEASDSIKVQSLKTANNELTDSKLGDLINQGDASLQHHHDSLYFGKAEYVSTSAGAADAGKPIILSADGTVDRTMLDVSEIAHDDLAGVADSIAHLHFPLLEGGRAFTAVQQYNSSKTFASPLDLVSREYVDSQFAAAGTAAEWQDSVMGIRLDPTGLTPAMGDRYLINGIGAGAFAGHDNAIAEWNGTAWEYTMPTVGTFVSDDSNGSAIYYFGGSSWTQKGFEATTASLGAKKVGLDIQADIASMKGIRLIGNSLAVETGDLNGAGLIVDAEKLAIDFAVDFANDHKALAADDLTASIVPVVDAAGNFIGTDVEAVLAELSDRISDAVYLEYLAASDIAKGDLVYLSAANTVSSLTDLTSNVEVIGVAMEAALGGAMVSVASIDAKLVGASTGLTAGSRLYWNAGTLVSSLQDISAPGANIWLVGVAVNTTDIALRVRHIRKNAA